MHTGIFTIRAARVDIKAERVLLRVRVKIEEEEEARRRRKGPIRESLSCVHGLCVRKSGCSRGDAHVLYERATVVVPWCVELMMGRIRWEGDSWN